MCNYGVEQIPSLPAGLERGSIERSGGFALYFSADIGLRYAPWFFDRSPAP
jgi:hypothetical protein